MPVIAKSMIALLLAASLGAADGVPTPPIPGPAQPTPTAPPASKAIRPAAQPLTMPLAGLEPVAVAPCFSTDSTHWVTAIEYAIIGVIPNPPANLPEATALASPSDRAHGVVFIKANGSWFQITVSPMRVRGSAVSTIDGRIASQYAFPPTPATVGGGGGHIMAQPQARGVTLTAGITRVFCGLRTIGAEITPADLETLSSLLKPPTAEEITTALP